MATPIRHSNSVSEAVAKYPTVKTTVNMANKLGIQITGHAIKLTKAGRVYQHWLWYKNFDGKIEVKTNEILKGMFRVFLDSVKAHEKRIKELNEQYKHPELQEGEVFLINAKDGEDWSNFGKGYIDSLRLGDVAYQTHSFTVVPGYKPLFGKLKNAK
jgi:hypothetical protein